MLNRDREIICQALKELGMHALSDHARQEQCFEVVKGYAQVIVKESFRRNRPDISNSIIQSGLITKPEFFIILSRTHGE